MIPGFCNPKRWKKINENFYISDEEKPDTAFMEETQDRLFNLEDLSWWFQYRSKIILSMMNRFFKRISLRSILELEMVIQVLTLHVLDIKLVS